MLSEAFVEWDNGLTPKGRERIRVEGTLKV